MGSRKIFAVLSEVMKGRKGGKGKGKAVASSSHSKAMKCELVESDSDDDDRHSQVIMKEICSLRFEIQEILKLTKGMKLPPGLYMQLKQTIKCHNCHKSPITAPVIYTRCCKNILGCESCVDRWYIGSEGRTQSCPL